MSDIFRDDELPVRGETHVLEGQSEIEFETILSELGYFQYQSKDRRDYGTDYILEALHNEFVTNMRLSAQLKGTDKEQNLDGTISISVERNNLNYLAAQPYSIYICFHRPTKKLYVREAEDVIREYEGDDRDWRDQTSITIKFEKQLDNAYLYSLKERFLCSARLEKSNRMDIVASPAKKIPQVLSTQRIPISVPDDAQKAADMLTSLSDANKDQHISDNFTAFFAVLYDDPNALQRLFFAEINLGVDGLSCSEPRIHDAIEFLKSCIDSELEGTGGWLYNLGNAYSVLNDAEVSNRYFKEAISTLLQTGDFLIVAMAYKNLGSNYESLGRTDEAIEAYKKSLENNPDLAETHFALGMQYIKAGNFDEALEHLDSVTFLVRNPKHVGAVQGWRINALFNLGEDNAAFREMFSVVASEENATWAWHWCARQVQQFGCTTQENLKKSIRFWSGYLNFYKDEPHAVMQLLLCQNKLLQIMPSKEIDAFQMEASLDKYYAEKIIDDEQAARIYDKVGHRYQHLGDWLQALAFFEHAYELDPEPYACCFATAFNHLNLWEDALEVLLGYESYYVEDDIYWYQRGYAFSRFMNFNSAIDAFKRAIELNNDYERAWFNLGGNYFNNGQYDKAKETLEIAINRFPDSDLVDQTKEALEQIPL